ncbi:DNA-binding domain-containing protein [Pararhodobacter aggregans]|uniref:HTH Mu-type domain-containing protein n=1 Tax=Pararhodobacter aggregans TaxID=404875 RepID=A0A2T7UMD7_9RHOB|nr:DNA-binding domain-containing protein [Pararhodobacter aggregans]PTW99140.1 Mu DNA-binding protein [Pararhodobacter aggregans]PVE45863.1 hypothetical protein DDE23_18765 [Pararhodobacter aggregans]
MTELAPAKHWWTAQELADAALPDLPTTRQNVERWIARVNLRANPGLARRRTGRGGGWEYHWSALPLAARRMLLAGAAEPVRANAVTRGQAWDWFEGLPEDVQAKARERLAAVQSVEALEGRLGRDLAAREVAAMRGVSPRTLWNWLALVEGVRPDDRLPHLAPKHRAVVRKMQRAEFDEEFFDWLKADYLRLAGPSFSSCYRRAERVAKDKGWTPAPERTMRRYLDARVCPLVSTVSPQTFRTWATGLLRASYQRRKSVRRTSASGCSFWPTPTFKSAGNRACIMLTPERGVVFQTDMNQTGSQVGLKNAASSWTLMWTLLMAAG